MHDSYDWGLDIQIAIDALTSQDGIITNPMSSITNSEDHIPIYFSNPDFLWGNEYCRPRFGQGAVQVNFPRSSSHNFSVSDILSRPPCVLTINDWQAAIWKPGQVVNRHELPMTSPTTFWERSFMINSMAKAWDQSTWSVTVSWN